MSGRATPAPSCSAALNGLNIAATTRPESPSFLSRKARNSPRRRQARQSAPPPARRPLEGHTGIGHTRWATHGRPSEENAHPHQAGPVAVIHNGIVENYVELRGALLNRGHKLKSETDTETDFPSHRGSAQARDRSGRGGARDGRAVARLVFDRRITETEPGRLVAAKTATPLVLGFGDGENFVASDIPAILEHTRLALVMEDGEIADITADGIRLTTFAGDPIERSPRRIEWDAVAATKGGFSHYLRKEISEQPQAWIDTLSGRASLGVPEVRFESDLLPPAAPPPSAAL